MTTKQVEELAKAIAHELFTDFEGNYQDGEVLSLHGVGRAYVDFTEAEVVAIIIRHLNGKRKR